MAVGALGCLRHNLPITVVLVPRTMEPSLSFAALTDMNHRVGEQPLFLQHVMGVRWACVSCWVMKIRATKATSFAVVRRNSLQLMKYDLIKSTIMGGDGPSSAKYQNRQTHPACLRASLA